jgi:hypothetical protein
MVMNKILLLEAFDATHLKPAENVNSKQDSPHVQ